MKRFLLWISLFLIGLSCKEKPSTLLKPPSDGFIDISVDPQTTSNLFYPDAAFSDSGFCIVYQSLNGEDEACGILVRDDKSLPLDLHVPASDVMMPRLAIWPEGDFVVTLEGKSERIFGIYWRVFDRYGHSRGEWMKIKKKGHIGNPDVAVTDSLILIVYQDGSGASWDIYLNLYTKKRKPIKLNVPVVVTDSFQDLSPRVSTSSKGFVVAWTAWGNGTFSVLTRFFDKELRPLTPPIELGKGAKDIEIATRGDTILFVWVESEKILKSTELFRLKYKLINGSIFALYS